jgi:hypothetical protein
MLETTAVSEFATLMGLIALISLVSVFIWRCI